VYAEPIAQLDRIRLLVVLWRNQQESISNE
ncbi:MAG: rod shape-determining protein MreC, partial [Pseudomonadota bacterium]|nr:rod shape-determining protein MreC [Pseudomonadota bacterium]